MKKNYKIALFSSLGVVVVTVPVATIVALNWKAKTENPTSILTNSHQIKRFFSIGDSLIDSGALIEGGNVFLDKIKVLKLLGIDELKMFEPYYEKKYFSNGPNAVKILSEKLGTEFKAGWNILGTFKQKGTNYAAGSARITAESGSLSDIATNLFRNNFSFKTQVKTLIEEYEVFNDDDLIYINIGNNDILELSDRYSDVVSITPLLTKMANIVVEQIDQLIAKGMKNIILSTFPDFGLLPHYQNRKQLMTNIAQKYNEILAEKVQIIRTKHTNVNLQIHDLFTSLHSLKEKFLNRGPQYKFDSALNLWFGDFWKNRGQFKPEWKTGVTKENLDHYFFLDSSHPTKWVHEQLASEIYNLVVNKVVEKKSQSMIKIY